ncbi:MAG TPA: PaaI family thioesterase [Roseibacterium sp.]|nr:PaaI family thioesterase [Roseibacterium sp.]
MTPFEFAQTVFDAQPFTRDLGAELLEASADGVVVALDLAPRHLQQHGIVHGGVLSAMADIALAFAGGLAMGSDAVTSEFKINYIRPVTGAGLLVRAEALGVTKRQAVVQARVFAGEALCCVAQGTIIRV